MWTLLPYTTLFRSSDPVRLHRRVAVPPDRTAEVLDLFSGSAGTAHLAVLPDASRSPRGDLVMADVARESADDLIAELRRLGVARDGGIAMEGVAPAVSTAGVLAGRALGWFGTEVLTAERSETGFITAPDRWSLVVAVLAGIAGVLSLTSARSGALVGVFISVTTVPAAADMAVSLALGGGDEFVRAATQLGINLLGILAAALATLAVQRAVWRHVPRVVPRVVTVGHAPR